MGRGGVEVEVGCSTINKLGGDPNLVRGTFKLYFIELKLKLTSLHFISSLAPSL